MCDIFGLVEEAKKICSIYLCMFAKIPQGNEKDTVRLIQHSRSYSARRDVAL